MSSEKPKWTWEEDGMKVVRGIARTAPGCHEGCGVLMYVKDGKLMKVEGNPDFPLTKGRLCPRCLALTDPPGYQRTKRSPPRLDLFQQII